MNSRRSGSFFFYGTLIDPDVRRLLLGEEFGYLKIEPAWIPGFIACSVQRVSYPALWRKPGARAVGILISGLSRTQSLILDRYEGSEYLRKIQFVRLANHRRRCAFVYMPRANLKITSKLWFFKTWIAKDKAQFLRTIGS